MSFTGGSLNLMFISTLPLADLSDSVDNMQKVGEQIGFNGPQFISQIIAATILFVALQMFAWKPAREMLELRRKTIEDSVNNAEKVKKEVAAAEAARVALLQKANEQANAIIADAEKSAAIRTERRTQEAAAQAEEIIRKAREASVLERDRLLAELKQQVASLVIQTTEKIAGKVLTADDQVRLNAETQQQLNAAKN